MRNKIVVLMVMLICFAQAIAFANSGVVKIGVQITDKTYKEKYSVGDTFVVKITIDEACDKLGSLVGSIKFDAKDIEITNTQEDGIEIIEDGEVEGYITPKYVGQGEENQIIFWIEDKYNRLTKGTIGRITFKVNKEIKAEDIVFNFTKVEVSDYDLKTQYQFERTNNSNIDVVNKPESNNEEELDAVKESIVAEENEKYKLVLDVADENNTNKEDTSEDEKGKTSTSTSQGKEGSNSSKNNASSEVNTKLIKWTNSSNWVVKELEKANEEKLIPENFDGMDFTKPITRKYFAAIAVKLYENLAKTTVDKVTNNPFEDTQDEYVLKAYELGITKGTTNTKFSPDSEITREQMATMMLRAISKTGIDTTVDMTKVEKFVDEDEMHTWGKDAIYYMASRGIIKGISSYENRFGVKNNATIEQAIAISLRSIEK